MLNTRAGSCVQYSVPTEHEALSRKFSPGTRFHTNSGLAALGTGGYDAPVSGRWVTTRQPNDLAMGLVLHVYPP